MNLFSGLIILALSVAIAYLLNWLPKVIIPNPYAAMINQIEPPGNGNRAMIYELQGQMYEKRKALKLVFASTLIMLLIFFNFSPNLRVSLLLASAGTIIYTLVVHLAYSIIYQDDTESYMVWATIVSILALIYASFNFDTTLRLF